MSSATLESIDAAVFATLERLRADQGGPFQGLERFAAKDTGRDLEQQINAAAAGQSPALLLAFEGETYRIAPGSVTAAGQQNAFVGTVIHRVFVSHTELAGHEEAITGQAGTPGILALVSLVVKALAGLRIPGLYQRSRLVPIDTRAVLIKPGVYIYLSRFGAQRFINAADAPDPAVPMEEMAVTIRPKAEDVPSGIPDGTGALIDGIAPITLTLDLSE